MQGNTNTIEKLTDYYQRKQLCISKSGNFDCRRKAQQTCCSYYQSSELQVFGVSQPGNRHCRKQRSCKVLNCSPVNRYITGMEIQDKDVVYLCNVHG